MSEAVLDVVRTIEQMDDDSARAVYDWLNARFQTSEKPISWDDIEDEEPDEFDLEMLASIENDPNCKEFVSEDEMFVRLLARK